MSDQGSGVESRESGIQGHALPPASRLSPPGTKFPTLDSRLLALAAAALLALALLPLGLSGYGVQVLQAQLSEFAPCRAIAINGNAAIGNYSLWTGF